jgi:hypothetical protein
MQVFVQRHCRNEAFHFALRFSIDGHPEGGSVHRNCVACHTPALHQNTDLLALKRDKRHKFFRKLTETDCYHVGFHWYFLIEKLNIYINSKSIIEQKLSA